MGFLELIGITIPVYVWIGLLLFIVGILLSVYIPLIGKKLGIPLVIIGLVLMLGITVFKSLWEDEIWFKVSVIGAIFIILIAVVLTAGKKKK